VVKDLEFLYHVICGTGTPPTIHDRVMGFLRPTEMSLSGSVMTGASFLAGAQILKNAEVGDTGLLPTSLTAVTRNCSSVFKTSLVSL
jgi:hypothetical protein